MQCAVKGALPQGQQGRAAVLRCAAHDGAAVTLPLTRLSTVRTPLPALRPASVVDVETLGQEFVDSLVGALETALEQQGTTLSFGLMRLVQASPAGRGSLWLVGLPPGATEGGSSSGKHRRAKLTMRASCLVTAVTAANALQRRA